MESNGCEWNLKASLRKAHGNFQIMQILGPHTCMSTIITHDHPNLSSTDIVEVVKEKIIADPKIKEKVLMATAKKYFWLPTG